LFWLICLLGPGVLALDALAEWAGAGWLRHILGVHFVRTVWKASALGKRELGNLGAPRSAFWVEFRGVVKRRRVPGSAGESRVDDRKLYFPRSKRARSLRDF
jgi:hypothetical protein